MDQNLQYSKKRLFVGNLPRDVSNYDDLVKEFSAIGQIAKINEFPAKGFMFLEYATDELAQTAVLSFGTYKYQNRYINIQFAKEREKDIHKQKNQALEKYLQLGGFKNQNIWGAQQSSGQNMDYGGGNEQNWEGEQAENFSTYNDYNDWYNNTNGGQQTEQSAAIPPPPPPKENPPRDTSFINPSTNRDRRNESNDTWENPSNKRNLSSDRGDRWTDKRQKSPEGRKGNQNNSRLKNASAASNLVEANDVEIVCFKEKYTKYAEWIEERLTTKGLKVDILYPNPDITLGKVEKAERPTFDLTPELYKIFKDLYYGREVEIAEYDKAIQYLVNNRDALLKEEYGSKVPAHLLVPPCAPNKDPSLRGKQEEVQEYILEILNKNPDILMQTKELPGFKAPQHSSTGYSKEAASSLDHAPNSMPSNMNNMNNFNMADMGKLFGMMQSMLQQNQSVFNS